MTNVNLPLSELIIVAFGGAFGSLVKDLITDGAIQLPSCSGKKLYLGFIAGAIIGGFVGVVIDGTFTTALMAGYTGTSLISKLIGPIRREEIKREDKNQKE